MPLFASSSLFKEDGLLAVAIDLIGPKFSATPECVKRHRISPTPPQKNKTEQERAGMEDGRLDGWKNKKQHLAGYWVNTPSVTSKFK